MNLEDVNMLLNVCKEAPILSKYHGKYGFEVERFIADYESWMAKRRAEIRKFTATTAEGGG